MSFYSVNIQKRHFNFWDIIILGMIVILFYIIVSLGEGMVAPFFHGNQIEINLSYLYLPYYAARSLFRMFIAFGCAIIFSLVYGYIAAKSKTAEKIMIPILDILQSVPVLGFLSVTIVAFMALFPNNLLGVELASIFAIFTGQAWNIAFSFYNSLMTVPKDLKEAADVLRLNAWQKFYTLELPFSMIGLIWNSMMSFGGGWFFLAASEAITVLGEDIRLPGIGSYLATAIDAGNVQAIFYSIITMIIMILLVDLFFWRPLVVWSQKFKVELNEANDLPKSFMYDLLTRSMLVKKIAHVIFLPLFSCINDKINKCLEKVSNVMPSDHTYSKKAKRLVPFLIFSLCFYILLIALYKDYLLVKEMDTAELFNVFLLGFYTLIRVVLAVILGAVWAIPVGVWIGLNARVAKIFQPIVQILASFPANMLFPFVTVLFLKWNLNFEWSSVALMMLGTQWYILFNVIAGAMSIPNDLHEVGKVFKIKGWKRWRVLILPAIFPYLITGAVTASGGAWNASIVSEIVSWHNQDMIATGLGAYISQVTTAGNWVGIVWGITVMCVFVVFLNRFIWRKLYSMAENKYHIN